MSNSLDPDQVRPFWVQTVCKTISGLSWVQTVCIGSWERVRETKLNFKLHVVWLLADYSESVKSKNVFGPLTLCLLLLMTFANSLDSDQALQM